MILIFLLAVLKFRIVETACPVPLRQNVTCPMICSANENLCPTALIPDPCPFGWFYCVCYRILIFRRMVGVKQVLIETPLAKALLPFVHALTALILPLVFHPQPNYIPANLDYLWMFKTMLKMNSWERSL
jgi:hypothetical protein